MRVAVLFCVALASVVAFASETAPREARSSRLPLQDREAVPAESSSGRPVPAGHFTKFVPTGLYQPRRQPATLALGNVSSEGVTPCGEGFPEGAQCTRLSVDCPGLPVGEVIVAVTEPGGTAVSTVILHNGSGGTTVFDNGFPVALLARGIRVAQIVWVTDWPDPAGAKTSACRPASVFQWVFDHVHDADTTRGFCALGHSGGSAAVADSLAFYGLDGIFDFALMNSGPPLGRIDYGCEPSLYTGGPRFVCLSIPNATYAYEFIRSDEINLVEGTAHCGDPYGDSTSFEISKWTADSVVSSGGVYYYPQTPLSFWFCANSPNSAVGQASFYVDQVLSTKSVNCVGGECVGEGTYRDPEAFDRMVDEIATSCVPNHFTRE
jgi:hypothetical protein